MKTAFENKKISLVECKKILNTDGIFYTDEEVIELRDWLYHMAEIVFDTMDREHSIRQMELTNNENEIKTNA